MARAQGARALMALAFETTYGTPPASGFTRMPFASTSLGAEQPLLNSELLGYGRDPLAPIKDAVTADGDVVVPLDAEAFGFWLKAAFGAPTTTGMEAPYTHEFRSASWTLPSMSIETGMAEKKVSFRLGATGGIAHQRLHRGHQFRAGSARLGAAAIGHPGSGSGRDREPLRGRRGGSLKRSASRVRSRLQDNPLTDPDLGLTGAATDALQSANTYRGVACDLAESARAPLESWQALRDAVRGSDEDGADALSEASDAAERFETALGAAGQAAGATGAAAGAAAAAATPDTEAAVTGWQAVTAALSDYADKARSIGGDIGKALVSAFQSAENAVGEFVKTGKLNFRDLVTSIITDLAQLAARRFTLGPIAGALSGVLGGAGGIFADILHAGGVVGAAGPSRMVPAMAFAAAPRMHSGGMAGLRHDEVPAILQRGERVLSRRGGAGLRQSRRPASH